VLGAVCADWIAGLGTGCASPLAGVHYVQARAIHYVQARAIYHVRRELSIMCSVSYAPRKLSIMCRRELCSAEAIYYVQA